MTKITRKSAESVRADDKPAPDPSGQQRPHRWTFLTNHAHVLILLHSNPDQVLREVATEVGITERAVQRIVQDLEEAGFVERERVGRRNRYRIYADKHLRHPIESHCEIADLIELVTNSEPTPVGESA